MRTVGYFINRERGKLCQALPSLDVFICLSEERLQKELSRKIIQVPKPPNLNYLLTLPPEIKCGFARQMIDLILTVPHA